jgi:hypothetical protein
LKIVCELLTAQADPPYLSGGIAHHEGMVGDIIRDHGRGADDRDVRGEEQRVRSEE